jgi:glycosyltransferase involved in cell wall biosynthesis
MKITLGIITWNEEGNLRRCLESVRGLVEEIVVVDSGSTDGTEAIAREYGARWETRKWDGYVGQKNHVLGLASHRWVLSLDADEALSPELREELLAWKRGGAAVEGSVEDAGYAGYAMPRCVCYEGRWIRHGDWYPDRLTRLFLREKAHFAGGRVHERLVLEGPVGRFTGEIQHFSFRDAADHWARGHKYAHLWAEDKRAQGRRCRVWDPVLHGVFRWFRAFVLRGGFLDGALGLRIATYSACEVYRKYALLRRLWQGT